MENIKLIASDMDHTLLTEKGELPVNFDDCILELEKLRIDFVIASGRPLYTLNDIFPELKYKMSFISDNGGVISYKGEILFKSLLKPRDYQSMIKFVESNTDGIAILCSLDSALLSERSKKYEGYLKTFYSKISFIENLDQVVTDADKFTIYFPNKDSKEYYEKVFKPKYDNDFSVTVSDTVWIDIMNYGIDKGKAMKILGEHLGIGANQMMAFGDSYNDIEMLQAVKHSYVVENANEEMKQYAKYVTDSNNNFGVIKVIDKIIQIHNNM